MLARWLKNANQLAISIALICGAVWLTFWLGTPLGLRLSRPPMRHEFAMLNQPTGFYSDLPRNASIDQSWIKPPRAAILTASWCAPGRSISSSKILPTPPSESVSLPSRWAVFW